jgi:DNA mismatch repair protein MutL
MGWPHRRYQHWSVNRRPVRSQLLTHALYEGYRTLLRRGQHPAALLHVTLDPAGVDVNIHPAKLEIRFAQPQAIHALVRDAVSERLADRLPSMAYGDGGRGVGASEDALLMPHGPPQIMPEHEVRAEQTTAREPAAVYEPAPLLTAPLVEPLGQLYQTYIVAVADGSLQIIDQHAAQRSWSRSRGWCRRPSPCRPTS